LINDLIYFVVFL